MATIKSYITPQTVVIPVNTTGLLCSSYKRRGICTEWCKHWHFCRDRQVGKECDEKTY